MRGLALISLIAVATILLFDAYSVLRFIGAAILFKFRALIIGFILNGLLVALPMAVIYQTSTYAHRDSLLAWSIAIIVLGLIPGVLKVGRYRRITKTYAVFTLICDLLVLIFAFRLFMG